MHQIYQFRGALRSCNDTVAVLLDLVCGVRPDPEAWQTLADIAIEQQGPRADGFLSSSVVTRLSRLKTKPQKKALASLVVSIIRSPLRASLLVSLAKQHNRVAQRLALRLVAQWPVTLSREVLQAVGPLLSSGKLSTRSQIAAVGHCLAKLPRDDVRHRQLIEALTADRGSSEALSLLHRLREKTGPHALIQALLDALQRGTRPQCPRCGLGLLREALAVHLWQEHRLILDGESVREPWALLEEWLRASRGIASNVLLERCQRFAQQLDPIEGQDRLQRLLMVTGSANAEARRQLFAEAEHKKASLCPSCYAMVSVPQPHVEQPLNLWRGRLSGGAFRLEIADRGLLARVELRAPRLPTANGRESNRLLTLRGAAFAVVTPILLLALLFAFGSVQITERPLIPVLITVTAALFAFLVTLGIRRDKSPVRDRAVDLAWTWLAPQLLQDGFNLEDSQFLARLALRSVELGDLGVRAESLMQVVPVLEKSVHEHGEVASHLAALRRLIIEDAFHKGEDPIELVARELARALQGELPFAYVESLLFDWQTEWWSPGNLARVRILLCNLAFEAGYEVQYLLDLGESYPALGDVLQVHVPEHLVHLRLLWSLRPTCPWDHAGRADNVFEWAEDPRRTDVLEECPDLLLAVEDPEIAVTPLNTVHRREATQPLQILVRSQGLMLQGTLFQGHPSVIEVNVRRQALRGGFELKLGQYRFHFDVDPNNVAIRLERWFRYLFREFLPQTQAVLKWRSPDRAALLRSRGALPCPECRKPLLPRVGKVGKALS